MKVSFFLPIVALAARVAMAAMPPACLLHAVNTQDNPADMSAVCGSSNASKVQSAIASMCSGDAASVAQSAFIATCSGAGVKVASYTATASPAPTGATRSGTYIYTTAVYNSSCSCTQTIVTSADGSKATGGSATASRSGSSGAAVSTAGAVHAQQKMGGYAAAAIALVGAVAAL